MLFKEIIAVYSKYHTKPINTKQLYGLLRQLGHITTIGFKGLRISRGFCGLLLSMALCVSKLISISISSIKR
jgi:hypothetical protein